MIYDAIPGEPSIELCGNMVDEDCDGEIDDQNLFPDLGANCVVGIGLAKQKVPSYTMVIERESFVPERQENQVLSFVAMMWTKTVMVRRMMS